MGFFDSIWSGIKSGVGKASDWVGSAASGIGKVASTIADGIGKIRDLPLIGNIASTILSPVQGIANTVSNVSNTVAEGAGLVKNLAGSNNITDTGQNLGKIQNYINSNNLGKYQNAAENFIRNKVL